MTDLVYTIGHSTHEMEALLGMLAAHRVTAIADVRSAPYSKFTPQFNREALAERLKAAHIAYVYMGRELGGRSDDRATYIEGRISYDLLARTPTFHEGLDRIAAGLASHQIALLCAEKDPLTCHRAILVCRHLAERGIGATHILEDGRLEAHDDALNRLLTEHGIANAQSLFGWDGLIAEAYGKRGRKIAYTERQPHPA